MLVTGERVSDSCIVSCVGDVNWGYGMMGVTVVVGGHISLVCAIVLRVESMVGVVVGVIMFVDDGVRIDVGSHHIRIVLMSLLGTGLLVLVMAQVWAYTLRQERVLFEYGWKWEVSGRKEQGRKNFVVHD